MNREQKGKICFVSSIICDVKGEFIRTLENIEQKIKYTKEFDGVVYVFPIDAKDKGYMVDFVKNHTVYFIKSPETNKKKNMINFVKGIFSIVDKQSKNQLNKIIKKENIKIIHSHFEEYDFLCHKVAKINKIKLFIHYHDAIIDYYKQLKPSMIVKLKLFLLKWKYKKLLKYGYLIAVSEYSKAQLINFTKSKKVLLVRNSIDLEYINERKNYPQEVKVFGSIVTRIPKGLYTILDALDIFYQKEEKVVTKLICTNETKSIIENKYSHLISSGLVEIHMPFADINEFLDQIDCYISASYFETFSYAIAESLIYGLPCILSDIDSTKWATAVKNVDLYKNKDPKALYECMNNLLKEGTSIKECKNARQYMCENYNINNLINSIIDIYTTY